MRRVMPILLVLLAPLLLGSRAQAPDRLFGQTPSEFADRRAAVRAAAHDAVVLLFGPGESSDIERTRFRTDSDLMYLTGVEAPDAVLALLPEGDPSGKREILFLPQQSEGARQWTDALLTPGEESQQRTGIQSVQDVRRLWEVLRSSIGRAKAVRLAGAVGSASRYLPDGSGVGQGARYLPNAVAEERIREISPSAEIQGRAEQLIAPLRYHKSAGEIANMRAAIAATGAAEIAAGRAIHAGASELAVEGLILAQFRRGGAVREGFPCIVGSGPNSTVLHHFSSSRRMRSGETVVVDIGAEYNYYSADITRTFPVSGHFTPRQRQIYQLVLDTQTACQQYAKPGKTTLGELHNHAVALLHASPLRAKDANGDLQTMDRFFPHGLGHPVGMDVHDVGAGRALLDSGVVFTIEPGLYIPSEGIGFRIEDDYLVTPTGAEKLSAAIPSEVPQIERLMARIPHR